MTKTATGVTNAAARRTARFIGGATVALAALLPCHRTTRGQQSTPPAQKPDPAQPAGDVVAPRAGEKKSPADVPSPPAPAPAGSVAPNVVRTLDLPEMQFDLPPGPGRETVVARCVACHSTRYITIQPPLSRETWVAEVTKMQKTFGAPIPDDQTAPIVNYLVAVRGPRAKD